MVRAIPRDKISATGFSVCCIQSKLRPNLELEQPAVQEMPEWNGAVRIGACEVMPNKSYLIAKEVLESGEQVGN